MTLEQPVHQGDDLCPTRDGTRGDWPLPETALGMERESLLPRRHTGKGKTGRDFVSNPVGLLGFEDINGFFPPRGSCMAEEGSCPSFAGKAKPSSQHRRAKLLSSDTPGLWRGLAAHRGHGLNSGSVNPGLGLHLANQVWMRPNDEVTAPCDPKTRSPILRNSCSAQFREVKDILSGEMDVPRGPKSHPKG